jgi:hypothetical protein
MTGENGNFPSEKDEKARRDIDRRFPAGQFVAIEQGCVVADAETHRKLVEKLVSQGKRPKNLLIVQAGVVYPDSAIILTAGRCATGTAC